MLLGTNEMMGEAPLSSMVSMPLDENAPRFTCSGEVPKGRLMVLVLIADYLMAASAGATLLPSDVPAMTTPDASALSASSCPAIPMAVWPRLI